MPQQKSSALGVVVTPKRYKMSRRHFVPGQNIVATFWPGQNVAAIIWPGQIIVAIFWPGQNVAVTFWPGQIIVAIFWPVQIIAATFWPGQNVATIFCPGTKCRRDILYRFGVTTTPRALLGAKLQACSYYIAGIRTIEKKSGSRLIFLIQFYRIGPSSRMQLLWCIGALLSA